METNETQIDPKPGNKIDRLNRLGFKEAAFLVREKSARSRKLMIAYEHYRFVRDERITEFNAELKKKTIKGKEPYDATWQVLQFRPIEDYRGAPPEDVLDLLEVAQERKCFDAFEVAHIAQVKDPILFGRVSGCTDRFFIGQWNDDVKITDLIKDNEG